MKHKKQSKNHTHTHNNNKREEEREKTPAKTKHLAFYILLDSGISDLAVKNERAHKMLNADSIEWWHINSVKTNSTKNGCFEYKKKNMYDCCASRPQPHLRTHKKSL